MLFGVHHILNNFLNQMQYFKIKAEATPGFEEDVIKLYDQMIEEATKQVAAMGDVAELDEESIRNSVIPR